MGNKLTKSDLLVLAFVRAYGGLQYREMVRVMSETKITSQRTAERVLPRLKDMGFLNLDAKDKTYTFEQSSIHRLLTMIWPRNFRTIRDKITQKILASGNEGVPGIQSDVITEATIKALDNIADTYIPSSDYTFALIQRPFGSENGGKNGGAAKNTAKNDEIGGKNSFETPPKPCRHFYRQNEKNEGQNNENGGSENLMDSIAKTVLAVTAKNDENRRVKSLCINTYIREIHKELMAANVDERKKLVETLFPVFGLVCEILLSENVLTVFWEELNKKLGIPLGKNQEDIPSDKIIPLGKVLENVTPGKNVLDAVLEGAFGAEAPSPQSETPVKPSRGIEVVIRGEKKRIPIIRNGFNGSPLQQGQAPSPGGRMTSAQKAAITKMENKFAEAERLVAPRCHVRYQFMTPQERDYEYAKTYVAVMERYGIDQKTLDSFKEWVKTPAKFMGQKTSYKNNYRLGRIEADRRGCNYEHILSAAFDEWANKHSTYNFPGPQHLKGDVICTQIMNEYYGAVKGAVLTITREDILSGSPKKIALLPENFHDDPEEQPDEYKRQCDFYEDHVFQECERIARRVGGIEGAVTKAIEEGILPKEWAEGFGKHHTRGKIKNYTYEAHKKCSWVAKMESAKTTSNY